MFYHRTSQLIMEMAQSMHGFDTMAFSAGIGENSSDAPRHCKKELAWMGVKIDEEKNRFALMRFATSPHLIQRSAFLSLPQMRNI